jgi:hypothetical protein
MGFKEGQREGKLAKVSRRNGLLDAIIAEAVGIIAEGAILIQFGVMRGLALALNGSR